MKHSSVFFVFAQRRTFGRAGGGRPDGEVLTLIAEQAWTASRPHPTGPTTNPANLFGRSTREPLGNHASSRMRVPPCCGRRCQSVLGEEWQCRVGQRELVSASCLMPRFRCAAGTCVTTGRGKTGSAHAMQTAWAMQTLGGRISAPGILLGLGVVLPFTWG